jgi:hypothetical protein
MSRVLDSVAPRGGYRPDDLRRRGGNAFGDTGAAGSGSPIDQSEERRSSIFTAVCVGAVDADPELPVDVGRGRWSKQFDQLLLGFHAELAEDGG